MTILKWTKGVFNANKFIYFKDDKTKCKFNNFVIKYSWPEFIVPVKSILPAGKPYPKLPS